ncbi:MAG: iron-containing redox enzyme family protein [Rhizobiales bacterium]|nr:iron-containing redox enzyme family protein [Hyphomicrobiales bacterium]
MSDSDDNASSTRPALLFPIQIDQEKSNLTISTYDNVFRFDGIPGPQAAEIIRHINSGSTVEQISNAVQADRTIVDAFIRSLIDQGLATEAEPEVYTGAQFTATLRSFYDQWNDQLFSHSLWQSLSLGTASRSIVDGWLIETYHFIRGANARLPYAIAHTADPRVRNIFAHHYREEYDHYGFFAEALVRRQISPEHVEQLGPLVGTRAVINWTRRCARTDSLAYAACSGLLESTGTDSARARAFYRTVATNFDADQTNFIDPLMKHIDLDEGFEHGNVMADIFNPIPQLSAQRANMIVQMTYQFVETLMQWFSDIEIHYFRFPHQSKRTVRIYRSNPAD